MKELYDKIFDNLYDGLYFVDRERKITLWNKAAEKLSGYSKEEVVGQFCFNNLLDHVDLKGKHLCFDGCPLHAAMESGEPQEGAVYLKRKDGKRIPVVVKAVPVFEDGKVVGATEIFNDNYQYFKTLKELTEFKDLAFTDKLTSLPNRHYIDEFMEQNEYIDRTKLSVIFIDIDNFKVVNDTYGHQHGDVVLAEVGKAIKNSIKKTDEAFRYGGEEFLTIVFDNDFEHAKRVAERIRVTVENLVIKHEGKRTPVTISLGVTMMKKDELLLTAINRADKYMYQSKVSGKNRVTSEL